MDFSIQQFQNGLINNFGFTQELLIESEADWISRYGDSNKSKKDFIWHLYQNLLKVYAKEFSNSPEERYTFMRRVYCEMFSFLCKEGKKRTVAQKGILNCDIQLAALSILTFDVKVIVTKDCLLSKQYEEKNFHIT